MGMRVLKEAIIQYIPTDDEEYVVDLRPARIPYMIYDITFRETNQPQPNQ